MCFIMLHFMCLFINMSISVQWHKLLCTVEEMRLSKCSVIIIIINMLSSQKLSVLGISHENKLI